MPADTIKFKINQSAGPITFGRMQTIATFLKRVKKAGLTMDDVIAFVEAEQAERKSAVTDYQKEKERRIQILKEKSPKCPDCEATLRLFPVWDKNPNNYQSRWACVTGWTADDPEKICGYEKLNTESVQEIYRNFGMEARGQRPEEGPLGG